LHDLQEVRIERRVKLNYYMIYLWIQYYAPKLLEKLKWYWKSKLRFS